MKKYTNEEVQKRVDDVMQGLHAIPKSVHQRYGYIQHNVEFVERVRKP